jgi:hypothetical protein
MSKFEHYNDGQGKDEAERLYGNDVNASQFNKEPFKAQDSIPENEGRYGESDDLSAEEKIYHAIDHEANEAIDAFELGRECDNYFNNRGKLPADLNEEQARELALLYQESLAEEDKEDKKKIMVKLHRKVTEIADLKPGQVAHATPNPDEKVQIGKKVQEEITVKKKSAAA